MATRRYRAVVMGASAGGLAALSATLAGLPPGYTLPVIVVWHVHPQQKSALALQHLCTCQLPLREAEDKAPVAPGAVYFAPPNYHLLVEDGETFALSVDEKVNFTRPAIDVLFESAVDVYGAALIGVIFSGANHDGAAGLRRIKAAGGAALVQDPATAEFPAMPRVALAATPEAVVLPPAEIGMWLASAG